MTYTVHQNLGPVVIVVTGSRCNLVKLVAIVVTAIYRVAAEEVGVILRAHVATAAPAFVTHTEIFYLPGFVATVLSAELGHRSIAIAGHIFHPFSHLLYCARTHVATDVRLAAQHLAEIQELVGTERVILDGATPVVVLHLRALLARTDTVHPVIFVSEASSRPS